MSPDIATEPDIAIDPDAAINPETGMRLQVLGASGSASGPHEPASCYLVTTPESTLVLDLGPGAFGALWAAVDPRRITAFLISHLHADHCLDLLAADVAAKYSTTAPWPRIPVYAPAHAAERLARAEDPDPGPPAEPEWAFDFHPWRETVRLGDCLVRTAPTAHPTQTFAIRIEHAGRSLVYTADTGESAEVTELARGADLLLAEASFPDHPGLPTGLHLSGRQAGRMAAEAGVGRLVVTHVPPWGDVDAAVLEARAEFSGPITAAAQERVHHLGQIV